MRKRMVRVIGDKEVNVVEKTFHVISGESISEEIGC